MTMPLPEPFTYIEYRKRSYDLFEYMNARTELVGRVAIEAHIEKAEANITTFLHYSKRSPVPQYMAKWLNALKEFRQLVQDGDDVWEWDTGFDSIQHLNGLIIVRQEDPIASITTIYRSPRNI
jgi:hypothetical protein